MSKPEDTPPDTEKDDGKPLPSSYAEIAEMTDVQFDAAIRRLKLRVAQLAEREKAFERSVADGSAAAPIREAHAVRAQALRALGKLLPAALAQAKKGHPALLRLILRSTR